jgi:hypothetical protein
LDDKLEYFINQCANFTTKISDGMAYVNITQNPPEEISDVWHVMLLSKALDRWDLTRRLKTPQESKLLHTSSRCFSKEIESLYYITYEYVVVFA